MGAATIKPGQAVATLALPLPLTGLSAVVQLVEHLYGTGDTRVQFLDDRIVIVAPESGFADRPKRSRFKMPDQEPDILATSTRVDGDEFILDAEHTIQYLGDFAASITAWLDTYDAVNFITMRLQASGDPEAEPHSFTIGRPGRPTPAELYLEAKGKLDELRAAIEDLELPEETKEQLLAVADLPASRA